MLSEPDAARSALPDEFTAQYVLGATVAETQRLQAKGRLFADSSGRLPDGDVRHFSMTIGGCR
jgi:hypothetical protein